MGDYLPKLDPVWSRKVKNHTLSNGTSRPYKGVHAPDLEADNAFDKKVRLFGVGLGWVLIDVSTLS